SDPFFGPRDFADRPISKSSIATARPNGTRKYGPKISSCLMATLTWCIDHDRRKARPTTAKANRPNSTHGYSGQDHGLPLSRTYSAPRRMAGNSVRNTRPATGEKPNRPHIKASLRG